MNLGDVAAWELQDRGLAVTDHVGFNQHCCACAFSLADRRREIGDLVARHLPPMRIREMAIGHQHGHAAEGGLDADASVRIGWSADLYAWRLAVVRNNFAMRESDKIADERSGRIRRDIDPVLRHGLQRWIIRRCRVPIELHVDAARPLNDGITADRVGKCRDRQSGAVGAGGLNGRVYVSYEIAGALRTEGIRNRRLETKD